MKFSMLGNGKPIMFDVFNTLFNGCKGMGDITGLSMSDVYGSINVTIDGEKYLLTVMKEEKKNVDDSV